MNKKLQNVNTAERVAGYGADVNMTEVKTGRMVQRFNKRNPAFEKYTERANFRRYEEATPYKILKDKVTSYSP